MTRILRFLGFGICLLLFACNSTNVPSKTPKKLVLASDFLERKDSTLFKGFKTKTGIRIVIVPMTVDSILKHQEAFGYNSKIDMVLMKSLYGINQLAEKKQLHPFDSYEEMQVKEYRSIDNDWVAFGIDPYVIAGVADNQEFQYNELTYGERWEKHLIPTELKSFQAAVLYQFGRNNREKSLKWLEKLDSQSTTLNDSLTKASYYLTKLSDAIATKKSYCYPNQSKKFGVFYDAVSFGIIRHGSNAMFANEFANYHLNLVHSQVLCNQLNILPTIDPKGNSSYDYQNKYPLLFRCTPSETVLQFRDLQRLQTRLEQGTKKPRLSNEAL